MQTSPGRLARSTLNRGHLPRLPALHAASPGRRPRTRFVAHLRAARRTLWIALFLAPAVAIQTILLLLPGRAKVHFATFFWASVARMLGLRTRIAGCPAGKGGRPVIYVCNHSSWMDIPALGGHLSACFVAKDNVARWPVIGTVARLGRTVFVSRNRSGTLRERDAMTEKLAAGDDLILFPEGTSSDGARVLPFRSAFFAAAYGDAKPLIQPVSVVYDRLAGLPVGHASRAVFAWYGDMSLAPHFWQAARWRGKRVSLLLHRPIDPADYADRKALAQATWQIVADGAAALRQNRATAPTAETAADGASKPAFA